MSKTKLLIELKGGTIVRVCANKDVDIAIVDLDLAATGAEPIKKILNPDAIVENLWEIYNNEQDIPLYAEVKEFLKRNKL